MHDRRVHALPWRGQNNFTGSVHHQMVRLLAGQSLCTRHARFVVPIV